MYSYTWMLKIGVFFQNIIILWQKSTLGYYHCFKKKKINCIFNKFNDIRGKPNCFINVLFEKIISSKNNKCVLVNILILVCKTFCVFLTNYVFLISSWFQSVKKASVKTNLFRLCQKGHGPVKKKRVSLACKTHSFQDPDYRGTRRQFKCFSQWK